MNESVAFAGDGVWDIAGWTMLHFLWIGTLIGGLAVLGRIVFRRASANVRYATALVCLSLMTVAPVVIAVWLASNGAVSSPVEGSAVADTSVGVDVPQLMPSEEALAADVDSGAGEVIELATGGVDSLDEPVLAIDDQGKLSEQNEWAATSSGGVAVSEPSPGPSLRGKGDLVGAGLNDWDVWFLEIREYVPYLPWMWILGTPITFALLAAGVVGAKRLERASRMVGDSRIEGVLRGLMASMRIGRRVTVAICDRIASPVLVGVVRPMILLPPAALTGWSPDEIEMVLLHELAHVRRWDNLVNLVQRIVESLLFFHPAVWLVSAWVRRERELCCDEFVVAKTDRPHAYAELLVALAAQMPRSVLFHPAASSAMSAGPLKGRIRRILKLQDDPMLVSGKSLALTLGGLLVAATLAVLYLPMSGQAEQSAAKKSTTEDTESTEGNSVDPLFADVVASTEVQEANRNESNTDSNEWPKGVVFPSPKEGEISKRAWELLGLKLVPMRAVDRKRIERASEVKVIEGAKMTPGVEGPISLVSINKNGVETFDDVNAILNELPPGENSATVEFAAMHEGRPITLNVKIPRPSTRLSWPTESQAKFPSLEQQKLADLVWKSLGLEMETLDAKDLERVRKLGYDGGLKVVSGSAGWQGTSPMIQQGDLLVGLHVWPTTSLQDVVTVLIRGDIQELNPLKFYVVRRGVRENPENPERHIEADVVVTGRAGVNPVQLPVSALPAPITYVPGTGASEGYAVPVAANPYRPANPPAQVNPPAAQPYFPTLQTPVPAEVAPVYPQANEPLAELRPAYLNVEFYYFYSPSSEPSKKMRPIAKRVSRYVAGVEFKEIDVEKDKALAKRFDIERVPTVMVLREGKLLVRMEGLQSEEDLQANYLNALFESRKRGPGNEESPRAAESSSKENETPKSGQDRYRAPNSAKSIKANGVGVQPPSDEKSLLASSPEPSHENRVVKSYSVPEKLFQDVVGYLGAVGVHVNANTPGRAMFQGTSAQHKAFQDLLDATEKWQSGLADWSEASRISLVKEDDGTEVLVWPLAGLKVAYGMVSSATGPGYRGCIVREVTPGSPAAWRDIQPDEFITSVQGFGCKNIAELESIMRSLIEESAGRGLMLNFDTRRFVGDRVQQHRKSLVLPGKKQIEANQEKKSSTSNVSEARSTRRQDRERREPERVFRSQILNAAADSWSPTPQPSGNEPTNQQRKADVGAVGDSSWADSASTPAGNVPVPQPSSPAVVQPVPSSPYSTQGEQSEGRVSYAPLPSPPTADVPVLNPSQASSPVPPIVADPWNPLGAARIPYGTVAVSEAAPTSQENPSSPVATGTKATPEPKLGVATTAGPSQSGQPQLAENGKSPIQPTSTDRVARTYEIPKTLGGKVRNYAKSASLPARFDNSGRVILQAKPEEHEKFKKLLENTDKWQESIEQRQSRFKGTIPTIVVTKVGDKDILEWPLAGLKFVEETTETEAGSKVSILEIAPGSPAGWQALHVGDRLFKVDQFRVGTMSELQSILTTLPQSLAEDVTEVSAAFFGPHGQRNCKLPIRISSHTEQQPSGRIRRPAERPRAAAEKKEDVQTSGESKPATSKSSANKANLRYDGKSFAQWRDQWQNELSAAKRAEAVRALGAFARAGYGEEAVDAILEVAGNYDFLTISQDPEGKLKQAVLDELTPDTQGHELAKIWLPTLLERVKQDPKKWQWLVHHVLYRLRTDDPDIIAMIRSLAESGPPEIRMEALGALVRLSKSGSPDSAVSVDEETGRLLAQALGDQNTETVSSALRLLLNYPYSYGGGGFGGGGGTVPPPKLIFQPQLVPLLFHAEEPIRQQAREVLQHIGEQDAPLVVETLVAVLEDKDDSRKKDHLNAILALAAMGKHGQKAVPELVNFLKESKDQEILVTGIVALGRSTGFSSVARAGGRVVLDEGMVASAAEKLGPQWAEAFEDKGLDLQEDLMERVFAEDRSIFPAADQVRVGGGGGMF